jgi:predicted enzyme related to lactoylglutathione lyase
MEGRVSGMTTTTTNETGVARLAMVNIDCAEPARLAQFDGRVLGWSVTHSEAEYAMISGEGTSIGFGRVEGYRAPAWPDRAGGKQFHLDLYVDDLEGAMATCRELGASVPDFQPGGQRWQVLLDPDGRPFCLCPTDGG